MSKISKEQVESLKITTRLALVQNPHLSSYQLAEKLGVEQNYALKLRKEVELENIEKFSQGTIREEIAKIQMNYTALQEELWKIIDDKNAAPKIRMEAIKILADTMFNFFHIKITGGLFNAHTTQQEINKGDTLVDMINCLPPEKHRQIIGLIKEALQLSEEKKKKTTLANNVGNGII